MTFSIIALDPETNEIGSAVASKWTAVGGCVPFFRAGVGMVHIQNHSCPTLAHNILDGLQAGADPETALDQALRKDPQKARRQCLIGDLNSGKTYAYSGADCTGIFLHKNTPDCAVAGNTLADIAVAQHIIDAFQSSAHKPLAERLMLALEAGQKQGGDARGQEAAALCVYHAAYPAQKDYPIDLRVDHDDQPLVKLRELYETFKAMDRTIIR